MVLVISLLAAVVLLPGQVHAQGRSCTVSIPVETKLIGDGAPSGTEFELVLEAADTDAPMPEVKDIKVKDSDKISFGPIIYTIPEDYQYRVYQKAGTAENFTYDETIYTVTVRVLNAEDGGLTAQIWAIRDGSDNKVDQITFENKYQAPVVSADPVEKPTVKSIVKTGDTSALYVWGCILAAAFVLVAAMVLRKMHQAKIDMP